ncbi:S-layer homology domain-containing protein [Alkaliphilus serpentinus]|uniref:S-layer homology domain-containing protein n=1 Tax=Alkaliphilus serpentinus TaxID=1482731 RepID=A0A833HQI9_9FIRM|nr:S-layer homology domain-containing protein [Alkaliphilus serpentinus]KAB3531865.1 S-layer homology domain-containing protein [Alkaliphilus serpentinus]
MVKHYKSISLILIALLIIQIIPAYGIDGFTPENPYQGINSADILLRNITMNDIASHWAREAIQEAAALQLMMGDSNTFRPDDTLNHMEAVTVLVRAIGMEAEAQQFGENQAEAPVGNFAVLSVIDNWAKGYVQLAIQNNIITNEEVNEILNITPQQAEDLEAIVEQRLDAYGEDITPQERAALEAQIRDQLELSRWKSPISRQMMALWIARALELQPIYGNEMIEVYSFDDWNRIDTDKIPYIEAILQEDIMSGMGESFSPNGRLTRGQMAQIMLNVRDDLLEKRGVTKLEGQVVKIEEYHQQGNHAKLITFETTDKSYEIISLLEGKTDFIVLRNNHLQLSSSLRVEDFLELFINPDGKIFYGRVIPEEEIIIEGFINSLDRDNYHLSLTDFDDDAHFLSADASTPVVINGKPATFKDLLVGQEAILTIKNNKVINIEGYLEEDPNLHGYIPPGSRTKVGDVLYINGLEIALKTSDGIERYQITDFTQVIRNENSANLNQIKKGDRVILSFDDIYSSEISAIQVEDDERHITAVYRGVIEQVNERSDELLLDKVEVLNNNKWVANQATKIKLKVGESIYSGGVKITLKELATNKGKEVYAAVESSYGVEKTVKVLLKKGGNQMYSNKITSIHYGTGRMVVSNNSINYHDGTIVIQNNRLLDSLNLEESQSVFLTADFNNNERTAAIVAIDYDGILDDRIDGSRLVVYRGKIDAIGDYKVTIGRLAYQLDYLQLEENKWVEDTRPTSVSLTDDTYVYDSELELEVDTLAFLDSQYIDPSKIKNTTLRNRIKNKHYLGKTAYFIVREYGEGEEMAQELLAINLTPHQKFYTNRVNTDHGAIGEIQSIDLDTGEITIGNLKNWNQLSNRWQEASGQDPISIDKAVILLNDEALTRDELYRIKDNASVYLIKNKDVSTQDDAYILIIEQ